MRRVFGWRVPLWLALVAVLPLAMVFLVSLALAGAIAAAVALFVALVLPRRRRPGRPLAPRADGRTIELERSDYRRLPRG